MGGLGCACVSLGALSYISRTCPAAGGAIDSPLVRGVGLLPALPSDLHHHFGHMTA